MIGNLVFFFFFINHIRNIFEDDELKLKLNKEN